MYTMDQLGTWSDMGSAVILPDRVHEKNRNIFLRVAARVYVSFYYGSDV